MGYVRMFQSSVDPSDIDQLRKFFEADVRPAFEQAPGCTSIDLLISTERNVGGLVDGCALSRWQSLDDLDAALATRGVQEALVRVLGLLRQEPVTRTYEVLD
jgi:quinol monooxygenase YgiN